VPSSDSASAAEDILPSVSDALRIETEKRQRLEARLETTQAKLGKLEDQHARHMQRSTEHMSLKDQIIKDQHDRLGALTAQLSALREEKAAREREVSRALADKEAEITRLRGVSIATHPSQGSDQTAKLSSRLAGLSSVPDLLSFSRDVLARQMALCREQQELLKLVDSAQGSIDRLTRTQGQADRNAA